MQFFCINVALHKMLYHTFTNVNRTFVRTNKYSIHYICILAKQTFEEKTIAVYRKYLPLTDFVGCARYFVKSYRTANTYCLLIINNISLYVLRDKEPKGRKEGYKWQTRR